jgi:hypothetical protein
MTSISGDFTHPSSQYAMTVLVPDVEDAQRLAAALDEVRRPDSPLAVIAVPPVRGLAFFADADRQAKLDRWWAHAIPKGSQPVYLLVHQEGVEEWLPGLDGQFIVGVPDRDVAVRYAALGNVTVADGGTLVDVAIAAVRHFAGSPMFRDDAAPRLEKRLRGAQPAEGPRFRRARLRPADEAFIRGTASEEHPIPNVPPAEGILELGEDAHREQLVRALAETLRRLQRIRTTR